MNDEDTAELDLRRGADDHRRPVLIRAGPARHDTSGDTDTRVLQIGARLELGRSVGRSGAATGRFDTTDEHMSRTHAVLRSVGDSDVLIVDAGSRNGTFVNGTPLTADRRLVDADVIFAGASVFVYRLATTEDFGAIIAGLSRPFGPVAPLNPAMARLSANLRGLADSRLDLLLIGETGVGKEVLAEAIHRESGRSGAFVAVTCAAIPATLLENELFGSVRGAHSAADEPKTGLVERAANGTLFLDELGDMPPSLQSKLLRFLQDRLVQPLGAVRPRHVDVRVLAATHRPVGPEDEGAGVRLDVAARIGPQPWHIPPLRTRREDIGLLVDHFLGRLRRDFDILAYQDLFLHDWPGNVRELRKVIELAAHVSRASARINLEHALPRGRSFETSLGTSVTDSGVHVAAPFTGPIAVVGGGRPARPSAEVLEEMLRQHHGDVGQVARELNRQRTLVWRWIRRAALDPAQFRRGPSVIPYAKAHLPRNR